MSVSLEASVGTLKQMIWTRNREAEPYRQRLVCKGEPLEDLTRTLSSYDVEAGGVLQLVVQDPDDAR